jgi:prepilin signal peptidase PulO-like enzyme (type II secretory pathway)
MLLFYFLIFILGLTIGSFLNVVIIRLKNKETIFKGRSHCMFCKKKLNWYELIPIISFIIQLGKCKKCKKKISWQYPLVELFTGLIFLLIFYFFGQNWQFPYIVYNCFLYFISCLLIIIFVYDLKHYLVADNIIYSAIIISFLFNVFLWIFTNNFPVFIWSIVAAILAGGFFEIIVLISKEKWMGKGDVLIGILMGLILGWPMTIVGLLLAFLIGAIVSLVLLILKKKKMKSQIPFGPFLVLGILISIFWGNVLITWYLNLL